MCYNIFDICQVCQVWSIKIRITIFSPTVSNALPYSVNSTPLLLLTVNLLSVNIPFQMHLLKRNILPFNQQSESKKYGEMIIVSIITNTLPSFVDSDPPPRQSVGLLYLSSHNQTHRLKGCFHPIDQ